MLEQSTYLLKNINVFGCFKKIWAPTVLEFCLFFLFSSGKKAHLSLLTPPPYAWRNQSMYGVSWPSPAGTESWIRFPQRLPSHAFITGNISGKQNSQHVYSSSSNHLKKENPNRNSDLFPLHMPLQSPCVKDGVAGAAFLFPAREKGCWIFL